MKNIYFILVIFFAFSFVSCAVIDTIAGAGFDPLQLEKAREARIAELKLRSALILKEKLTYKKPPENNDIIIRLSERMLNKFLDLYESSKGMLDNETSYEITKVDLEILNGSAIASVELSARNNKHNIDVLLVMDCLLLIEQFEDDLALKLEPFNISPIVKTRGVYIAAKSLIIKLLQLNLSELSKKLPFIKIPVAIQNNLVVDGVQSGIKGKINLQLNNPQRKFSYKLKINDILFFENMANVSLNFSGIRIKK